MRLTDDQLNRIRENHPFLRDADKREIREVIAEAVLAMAEDKSFPAMAASLHLLTLPRLKRRHIEEARRSMEEVFKQAAECSTKHRYILRFLLYNARPRARISALWQAFLSELAKNHARLKRETLVRMYKKSFFEFCSSRYLTTVKLAKRLNCPRLLFPKACRGGSVPDATGRQGELKSPVEEPT